MVFSFSNKITHRVLLAIVSGALGAWVFSWPGGSLLAWVWMVPLIRCDYPAISFLRSFLLGFLAGVIFFGGTCYWIINVLVEYGGMPWAGAVPAFLLLAGYLGLYSGAFLGLFSRTLSQWGWGSICLAPFIWVGMEYLRSWLLTGFPWCLSGYALVDYPGLCQLATLAGVYGLSFLVVTANVLLFYLLVCRNRRALFFCSGTLLLLIGMEILFQIRIPPQVYGDQSVRIVQTNLMLDQKWDDEERTKLFEELADMSSSSIPPSRDAAEGLLVWPETPAPFYYKRDLDFKTRMDYLASHTGRYFIFGFVDFLDSPSGISHLEPLNSVAFLSPTNFVAQYDKMHLVPFGEYVPYPSLFNFVDKISTEVGNFVPGRKRVVPLLSNGHKVGAFICYEAIFPDFVREFAREGAEVFVNVTNDGWFGCSTAPRQHLNMARLRAVENRRFLIRAANNGISAVIDPYGRIQKKTGLFVRTVLDDQFAYCNELTFYLRHGDWFAQGCGVIMAIAAILSCNGGKKRIRGGK
jgi:apolipoprotein N-acyltransferase